MTDEEIRKAAFDAYEAEKDAGGSWLDGFEAVYRAGMEAGRSDAAKPKRRKAATCDAEPKATVTAAEMMRHGVQPLAAEDWLRVRRQHKAPLTRTAWEATKREADAAHMTIGAAVQMCAERGWRGFRAEYVSGGNQHARPAESFQAQAALARVQRIAPGAARKLTPLESDAKRIYEACKASVLGEDDAGQPRLR